MAYDLKYDTLLRGIQCREASDVIALFTGTKPHYDVNDEIPYIFEDRKRYIVTPLYWAVRHRRPEICKYLLQNGAKPYAHMVYEYYPLHEACNRGFHKIVQLFVDAKCDLDRVTSDLDTPLHIACIRDHVECINLLLRAGADCKLKNKAGRTALEEATYHNHHDLVKLFHAHNKAVLHEHLPQYQPSTNYDASTSHNSHGVQLQRRHSYSNSAPKLLIKGVSPKHPNPRPQSALIDDNKTAMVVSGNLHVTTSSRTRSNSQQNLPTQTSQPYTSCSATSLQSLSTAVTQLSWSSADSPSPVENDGILSKETRLHKQVVVTSAACPRQDEFSKSVPVTTSELSCPFPSACSRMEPFAPRVKPYLLSASNTRTHRGKHRVRPLSESVSHPEFPLMKREMIPTDRATSCDELLLKENQRCFSSHSRRKIDSLSKHMWDSLESIVGFLPQKFTNPFLDAFQKAFRELAPTFDFTPAYYQALVEVNSPLLSHHSTPDPTPTAVQSLDSLHEVDYKILGTGPLQLELGTPSNGYACLLFVVQLKESERSPCGGELAFLKVIVRVFDLLKGDESQQYHTLRDLPTSALPELPPNEVAILQQLSPHPNIARLVHYHRGGTENLVKHVRKLDKDDYSTAYVMLPLGEFLFLQYCEKTLADVIREQKLKHGQPPFGISEETLITILAQLLFGVSHLNRFHIAHMAILPENVYMCENGHGLVITNFSHALSLKPCTLGVFKSAMVNLQERSSLALSPEVSKSLQSPEACLMGSLEKLFSKNDCFAAGRIIYEFILGKSHRFFDLECYTQEQIPYLECLSPRFNQLLRKLIACDPTERFSALEGAICCLVLNFGPRGTNMTCVEDCHRWIFSESMEFYMRPVLKDCSTPGYSDPKSKLHYVYLTVADPKKIWDACKFFNHR